MTLGIFSPGSPPEREAFEAGLAWLRARGFKLRMGATATPGTGLHAGPASERAADLVRLLEDPEVDAVLCARGGSGTLGLLPFLDDRIAHSPKPIIGLSDVTALHLALYARSGKRGISAPMVVQLSDASPEYTASHWLDLVRGSVSPGPFPLPEGVRLEIAESPVLHERVSFGGARGDASPGSAPSDAPTSAATRREGSTERAVRSDRAVEGPLYPCNLSLFVSLIGTPYLPSCDGAILVLEDIHETPQSLDRMGAQIRLSGAADRAAGIVLGQFTECFPRRDDVQAEEGPLSLLEALLGLGLPILTGFPYGHDAVCCALPFGARVRLTTEPPGLHLI